MCKTYQEELSSRISEIFSILLSEFDSAESHPTDFVEIPTKGAKLENLTIVVLDKENNTIELQQENDPYYVDIDVGDLNHLLNCVIDIDDKNHLNDGFIRVSTILKVNITGNLNEEWFDQISEFHFHKDLTVNYQNNQIIFRDDCPAGDIGVWDKILISKKA
ncbi:hypothetical protein [Lonepinella sp. BR2271]|uniref:hypothetical protein n=1 Tax=Lonepinella sp. BR2271 TaxID=3434550 RepID=UPI003F6DEF6E